MTLEEFRQLPQLSKSFPLVFESGATWRQITARCAKCNVKLPDESLRGEVTRPFRNIFTIDALAYCQKCEGLTTIRYNLTPDLGLSGKSPVTGEWARWEPHISLWQRFLRWIRSWP
jgi:hypothetical protein